MPKLKSSPMKPAAWIAIAAAILAGMVANAEAQDPVAVERAGNRDGRTVLFIPGLGTPGAVWDGTVAALGAEIDAHSVTLAGFGGLPADADSAVIAPAVEALAAYAEAQGFENAVLVGHSMGAQIALQLAAARPGMVGDVVVIDSAPFFARLFNPAITPDQAAAFGQGMAAQMAAMPRESFLAQTRQGLPVQSLTPEGQAQVMAWMEASDQPTLATAFGEVAGSDFTPVLDDVAAGVTVLVGWAEGAPVSAEALLETYRGQYAALEHARFEVIEDSRHFVMLDRPGAFHAELRAVVNGEDGE